jgi:hypothetical protein
MGKRKIFKKKAKRNIRDKNTIIPLPDEQNDHPDIFARELTRRTYIEKCGRKFFS